MWFGVSGWFGGSGFLFLFVFLKWKRIQQVVFHMCWSLFMDFWSLEITFGEIFVSLGRLWTRLVPGGVQGADLVEIVRPMSPFGSILESFLE